LSKMLRGVSSSLKHNIWESIPCAFSSKHGRCAPLFSDQIIAQPLLRPAACDRGLVEYHRANISSCKRPTDCCGYFTCGTKHSAAEVLIRSVVDQRKFSEARRSVHKYAHPSWPQNLPVECWHFSDKAAVSKLVPLQEFEAELNSGNMEKELIAESGESQTEFEDLYKNKVSKWYLFSRRDEVTARVLKQCFNLHDTRISNPLTRAKVEFVSGATRRGDHLLVGVHDYRLQENERDGVEGYIDDISWVQEIYSDLLSAPDDQAPFEDSGLLSQRLVAHEVLFVYFPATSTLITIGADSTYMVLCGRAIMLNQHSQVTPLQRPARLECAPLVNCRPAAPNRQGRQVRTANARGEVGAGTLLLVLLDAFMDSVFPVLTLLGDAVDGIARLSVRRPEARHVVLAKRVKQQLHKILKHAWQVPPHIWQAHLAGPPARLTSPPNSVTAARLTNKTSLVTGLSRHVAPVT
jgi:hypothetical protein